jgi:hypothetical protein
MRIGLFIPCYIDAFFPEVGIATLELLERFGHEVEYPRDQTCCGQPMANSGFNAECADTEAVVDASLTEQRILFLGAGSAGIGIANLIVAAMQMKGLSQDAARSRISMFDIDGLLEPSRADLSEAQKIYAHKATPSKNLVQTIETVKPTALIGVSTKGGAFTRGASRRCAGSTSGRSSSPSPIRPTRPGARPSRPIRGQRERLSMRRACSSRT